MDKASDYESGDCKFESCQDQQFHFLLVRPQLEMDTFGVMTAIIIATVSCFTILSQRLVLQNMLKGSPLLLG